MTERDPYEILGVKPNASHRQIVRAFARLAEHYRKEMLSDSDATERFQKVKEAYETVTDYDTSLRYNIEHGLPDPPRERKGDKPAGILGDIGVFVPENWPVLLPWLLLVVGGNAAYYLLVGSLPWFWLRFANGPEDYIIYPLGLLLFFTLAHFLARRS